MLNAKITRYLQCTFLDLYKSIQSYDEHKTRSRDTTWFWNYAVILLSPWSLIMQILPRSFRDWVNYPLEPLPRSQFKAEPLRDVSCKFRKPLGRLHSGILFSVLQAITCEVIAPGQMASCFWHYYRHWIHLWRFVRNIPGTQELKRVSRHPLEKKYCQGEEEALIGSVFTLYVVGRK